MKIQRSVERIADEIYRQFFGHLDDKRFHAEKHQEILDWLADGDSPDEWDLDDYIHAWEEYDWEDILANDPSR